MYGTMIGMHCERDFFSYNGSEVHKSKTFHYELPALTAIAQLSLAGYYECGDLASARMRFTEAHYEDEAGVSRDVDCSPSPIVLYVDGLTQVKFELLVANCRADLLCNVFFFYRDPVRKMNWTE